MNELPLLRFIPFRRSDLVKMCLERGKLEPSTQQAFQNACSEIEQYFQKDFIQMRQGLKQAYAPLDPDADTRVVEQFRNASDSEGLAQMLGQTLDRANYEKITREYLDQAFRSASLFKVRLHVDLNDFDEVLLYARGARRKVEMVPRLMGFFPKEVTFTNFDRVVLYIRFKEDADTQGTLGGCQPGSTMLKLFQNVPAADMEMLFPNTRVGMRWIDKLLIGVPAVVSGGVVMTTKLGATMVLLGSLMGFWFGLSREPVTLDKSSVIVLAAGIGALIGYLLKQISSFRNRKLKFTQALTESLYFKLLDNNAGVLYRVLDEAEESECKESLLAYYFLLENGKPMTSAELDAAIEEWFAQSWSCKLDFEIDDALAKLADLGLARSVEQHWQVIAQG